VKFDGCAAACVIAGLEIEMRHFWQFVLSIGVVAVTLFLWLTYVPAAASFLDRVGVAGLLGVEVQSAEASEGGGRFGSRGPAQVVVAEVGEGTVDDRVEAVGDGRALRTATLRADVGGEVVEVPLETGGYVDEGKTILRLDDEAQRIALERARLVREDAADEVARLSRLQDTGSVTEVRLREARLALRTAELGLREAEYELTQRTIRAPFSGWVGLLDVAVGDRLSPQDTVATITDRSEILIDFRVPERVVGQVEVGTPIDARPLGLPDMALAGEIHAIDNIVDASSRTLRVQGRLDNEGDRLRAGMSFAVTLRFPGEALPVVDPLAVQWSSEGSFVWAVRDGSAARVPVVIRQRDADRVLVEADLAPGEPVVIEGVQTLRPGADVAVARRAEARAESPSARATDRL
jgi:RND family efflux transporter MFP subunit